MLFQRDTRLYSLSVKVLISHRGQDRGEEETLSVGECMSVVGLSEQAGIDTGIDIEEDGRSQAALYSFFSRPQQTCCLGLRKK